MPARSRDPLESACFPLAPYCNRIREGRFRFGGRQVVLPPNHPPERHSLHGLSWRRRWKVERRAEDRCVLADEYNGSGPWPWPYRAEQRIRLGPRGCTITLFLTNRGEHTMPAGIGLHPYFRRSTDTRVRFTADRVLLADDGMLPTGVAAPPYHFAEWATGAALPRETVDHCFAGWVGEVAIEDSAGAIVMSASGAPHLHVYAPSGGSALCFEPVSHTPDALNRSPAEMTVLPPGCSAALTMRIAASTSAG